MGESNNNALFVGWLELASFRLDSLLEIVFADTYACTYTTGEMPLGKERLVDVRVISSCHGKICTPTSTIHVALEPKRGIVGI